MKDTMILWGEHEAECTCPRCKPKTSNLIKQ